MSGGSLAAVGSAVAVLVAMTSLWGFLIAPIQRDVLALQALDPVGIREHKDDLKDVRVNISKDIEVAVLRAALARCESKP